MAKEILTQESGQTEKKKPIAERLFNALKDAATGNALKEFAKGIATGIDTRQLGTGFISKKTNETKTVPTYSPSVRPYSVTRPVDDGYNDSYNQSFSKQKVNKEYTEYPDDPYLEDKQRVAKRWNTTNGQIRRGVNANDRASTPIKLPPKSYIDERDTLDYRLGYEKERRLEEEEKTRKEQEFNHKWGTPEYNYEDAVENYLRASGHTINGTYPAPSRGKLPLYFDDENIKPKMMIRRQVKKVRGD